MRKGLVLEGGGMRGLFTAGVLDVMMEQGICFDGIVGVSAGALFGCNYKSYQIGRALRYNIRFKDDPQYMGLRALLKTGNIVAPEYAYHVVPNTLDVFDRETFKKNPTEFHVVCTDVMTGEPLYHRIDVMDDEGFEWLRASGSMPLVSQPVLRDGRLYLDGGISDSIPIVRAREQGFPNSVVVLTRNKGYRKPSKSYVPMLFYRKYPALREALAMRNTIYNRQIEEVERLEQEGKIVVIRPEKPIEVGRMERNTSKLLALYDEGYEMAAKVEFTLA
jgi:predicted patatin/cPLA2 family phospholipase